MLWGKLASCNGRSCVRGIGQVVSHAMNGIHEFVIRGGQTVTAGQMDAFRRKLPFLKVKAEIIDEPELPHLKPQTNFLVRYAEDVLDGAYPCSDLQAIAETVFALSYLLKEVDIIPDSVPHLGLADDSAVLRAVLMGHKSEFRDFAKKCELDFDSVTTEP
jgi:uncharacterized membrane protein YkvA (DUF1232 family)